MEPKIFIGMSRAMLAAGLPLVSFAPVAPWNWGSALRL